VRPLTKSQAVVIMVMTGVQIMKGEDFRAAIEKKLGRVVNATEFATPEFIESLQQTYAPEFEKLCDLVEDSGLMLLR
jgi:hypothetical protein